MRLLLDQSRSSSLKRKPPTAAPRAINQAQRFVFHFSRQIIYTNLRPQYRPISQSQIQTEVSRAPPPKDFDESGEDEEEDDDDEHGNTLCGACGDNYASDEFWICCDVCERWFHGKCVKITPARAEHIKQYKCPSCSNKRARA